jgi:hypothetical protein
MEIHCHQYILLTLISEIPNLPGRFHWMSDDKFTVADVGRDLIQFNDTNSLSAEISHHGMFSLAQRSSQVGRIELNVISVIQ